MSARNRLKRALQVRAPQNGIIRWLDEWLDELANALGYDERETRGWYYGEDVKLSPDALGDLVSFFGPDFRAEIFPCAVSCIHAVEVADAYNDGHRNGVNDERERMIGHLQEMRDNGGGG